MRPTKNRVYCYGCQRSKMLFESKAKADNFIAYNSEGIMEENGKAPVRSYYCELCGGYHVTSNPSMVAGESLNQRDQKMVEQISNYKKGAEDYKQMHQVVSNQIDKAKRQMYLGNFEYIEELYEELGTLRGVSDKSGLLAETAVEDSCQICAAAPEGGNLERGGRPNE